LLLQQLLLLLSLPELHQQLLLLQLQLLLHGCQWPHSSASSCAGLQPHQGLHATPTNTSSCCCWGWAPGLWCGGCCC